MWGNTYVEPNDTIVLWIIFLCFAMCHLDIIDVISSRMTSREAMSFFSMYCIKVVFAWCHMSVVRMCMVY